VQPQTMHKHNLAACHRRAPLSSAALARGPAATALTPSLASSAAPACGAGPAPGCARQQPCRARYVSTRCAPVQTFITGS
jgi:hypothetical protein